LVIFIVFVCIKVDEVNAEKVFDKAIEEIRKQ